VSIWDDPTIRPAGDYVKFDEPGDAIVGEILAVAVHTFEDGKRAPKLVIRTDDGDERTLTAGQMQLSAKLAEQRPEVGDRIAVTYIGSEKRAGGKTLKKFDVVVKRGAPSTVSAADLI
jgi:hypothetical protein